MADAATLDTTLPEALRARLDTLSGFEGALLLREGAEGVALALRRPTGLVLRVAAFWISPGAADAEATARALAARLPDAQLIGQIVDMFARKSAAVLAVQVRALLQREDATPVLRTVRVPALVLCGREDAWSPVSQHQEIADLLPARPAVCVVEGAGHMVTMEQPEAVAGALVAWLQQEPAHALAHST